MAVCCSRCALAALPRLPAPPARRAGPRDQGATQGLAGHLMLGRGGALAGFDSELRRPLIGSRSVVRILAGAGAG